MTLTCLVCRKQNGKAASQCVRCGASLVQLRAVLTAAQGHCLAAASALRQRDYEVALAHAERSWQLCNNRPAVPIACVAAGAGGNAEELRVWRRRWRTALRHGSK